MEITKTEMQVFDGLMISDGSLRKLINENRNSSICFGVKHKEFLEKIRLNINFDWGDIIKQNRYDKRTKKTYVTYMMSSRVNRFFYTTKKKMVS